MQPAFPARVRLAARFAAFLCSVELSLRFGPRARASGTNLQLICTRLITTWNRSRSAQLGCAIACLGALACLALGTTGCERETPLALLTLNDVAPRDVEVGERLEISGAGFPRGRTARVILRGALHRPGASPLTGFEARTEGAVVADNAIELLYDGRLESLLCGPGERAVHTTFRGEVTVAFAAAIPGAPPASATLRDVVLDLRPPPGALSAVARMRERGEQFLSAAGIGIDQDGETPGGLVVKTVKQGSDAERAGVVPGDLMVSMDGVRTRATADAVPADGRTSVEITVRRGADPTERALRVAVSTARAQRSIGPAAALAVLAALAALIVFGRAPRGARWLARRIADGVVTARKESAGRTPARPLVSMLAFAAIPSTVAISLALREIAGGEPELVTLALAAVAAALALYFVSAEGGLLARMRAGLSAAFALLPAALAVGLSGLVTGATRASEASHLQGAWPWQFMGLGSLSTAILALTAMVSLSMGQPEADLPRFGRAARIVERGSQSLLFVLVTLLTVVFWGGWQSPLGEGAFADLIGAALLVAKAGGLGVVALVARRAAAATSHGKSALLGALGAIVVGLAVALAPWEPRLLGFAEPRLLRAALTAIVVVATARIGWMVALAARRPAPRLDPFA